MTLDDQEMQVMKLKERADSDRANQSLVTHVESRPSSRVFLERTKLPTYSGKVEEWPDFSKQWKELTKNEGFPEVIALSKLRDSLPAEGKDLLIGVESLDIAWSK